MAIIDNTLISQVGALDAANQARLAKLLDLQIEEASESREKKLRDRAMADMARKQGAEIHLRRVETQKVIQAWCRHRHPESDKPHVSAIRLPGGKMTIVCANEACMKTWEGSAAELRSHPELVQLFPKDEEIGGVISG
jgi:hypothetical protein